MLLLPLFRGFSPVYITEHIQKYYSIANFIKLSFQRVLINLNRSPNEGAMAVLFPLLHAVQKISEHATFGNSAIPACRNLRLTWFLIRWKHNFMGLLNIQRYPVVLPWGCAEIDGNKNFLWIDPKCWRPWSQHDFFQHLLIGQTNLHKTLVLKLLIDTLTYLV
jgi:hypothetical protein